MECILFGVLFIAIGFLILFCLGTKSLELYFLSPIFTFAFLGITTLFSQWIPWRPLNVFALLAAMLLLIIIIRMALRRCGPIDLFRSQFRSCVADKPRFITKRKMLFIGIGFIVNAIVVCALFVLPAPPLNYLLDNYDNPFHYSVIRNILETGSASPIGAGSVTGEADAIYPDLSHAVIALFVQLFAIDINSALWMYSFAILIFVVPFGMNVLALVLFKRSNGFTIVLSSVLATILPGSITYVMYSFGVLLSNYLGMALLPYVLFAAILALQYQDIFGASTTRFKRWLSVGALSVVCVVTLGLAHPNTALSFAILVLPLLFVTLRRTAARLALLGSYVIGWAILFQSSLFARTVNCLDRTDANSLWGDKIFAAIHLTGTPLDHSVWLVSALSLIPLIASIVLAIVLRKRWRQSWYLVGLGITATQMLYAFFPIDPVAIVATGFWYRDYVRFMSIGVLASVPLLACLPQVVVLGISCVITKRNSGVHCHGIRATQAVCYAFAICVGIGFALHFKVPGLAPFFLYNDMKAIADASATLEAERPKWEEIGELVGDSAVLNNNNDTSVWLYGACGVDGLIKGYPANQMSSFSDDAYILIENVDRIGEETEEGQEIRDAAERLGVHYVLKMSGNPIATTRLNELNQIDVQLADAILRVNADTPGLKLIQDNGYELYEIER